MKKILFINILTILFLFTVNPLISIGAENNKSAYRWGDWGKMVMPAAGPPKLSKEFENQSSSQVKETQADQPEAKILELTPELRHKKQK